MTPILKELRRPVNDAVVKQLEELLEKARKGKLTGFIYAGCDDAGGHTEQGFSGWVYSARMLGAIELLKHVIIRDVAFEYVPAEKR